MTLAFALLPPQTPRQIVEQTRAAYAELKTYSDEGVVENPTLDGGVRRFRTYFRRPNQLRLTLIEVLDEGSKVVFGPEQRWEIWPHGAEHALWTTWSKGLVQRGNLRELIQKPSASHVVDLAIKLLVPGVHYGNPAVDDFRTGRVKETEMVDRVPCVVLSVQDLDAALDIWIDAKTHLIRRFRWRADYSRARKIKGQEDWKDEVTTVTMRPKANPPLNARAMSFAAPKGVIWGKLGNGDES